MRQSCMPQITCKEMKPRYLIPAILLTLFVGYPLSIGPFEWLYNRRYGRDAPAPQWVAVIYTPLAKACEACPPLDRAMVWYEERWM